MNNVRTISTEHYLSEMDSDALRARISDCNEWVAKSILTWNTKYWTNQRDAALRALRDLHVPRTRLQDVKRRAM